MDSFAELAARRQSCRAYDPSRQVEQEKLEACLQAARLAPSACNSQPWHITLAQGGLAAQVGECLRGMGMNKFTADCPVFAVVTEDGYNPTAAAGARLKDQDYRSVDIGIMAAHFTLQAADLGLGSCILGWFDEKKIKQLTGIPSSKRLLLDIIIGYPLKEKRKKIRKAREKVVSYNKY